VRQEYYYFPLSVRLRYVLKPTRTDPSGPRLLGVDQKLIIIIIFANACMHTRFFTKCACMQSVYPNTLLGEVRMQSVYPYCTHFWGKRVCKACIPTCFLGKRVWKLVHSMFLLAKGYPLFFKACMQSVHAYTLFY
jgi:hypothetical protein